MVTVVKCVHTSGVKSEGTLVYQAAHHQILSHARAYRLYQSKYRSTQHGKWTHTTW